MLRRSDAIANDLRAKIFSGIYTDQLPTQNELAGLYNTSRITITKAIAQLRAEELIITNKGGGSFVRNTAKEQQLLDSPINIYDGGFQHFQAFGTVTSLIISFSTRLPEEREQQLLQLGDDMPVYDIIRLRAIDNQPVILEYTIMPVSRVPHLTEEILKTSIYSYITDTLQQQIGAAYRRIRADKSDAYDQKYLNCQINDPILEVEQVVRFANTEAPFEYSQTRHRYDLGEVTYISH
ncbi:MAG: GntR family transcriptional regulator [Aerococcus sp.]|nr:GntR family transcriptional regulator [Aerococcus sp.]